VLSHPDLARHCAAVVVAGGDGTVGDAINEPAATTALGAPAPPLAGVPLAVLPLGNENLLSQQFGFTGDPDSLVRAILGRKCRTVDLGRIDASRQAPTASADPRAGRRFGLMLSAGLDAEIVHRLARWRARAARLRRVRRWSYLRPSLAALTAYDYPEVELRTENEIVRGVHAFVFNLPCYAMGLKFVPGCADDDGLLDWLVFQTPGRLPALGTLWAVYHGHHLVRADVKRGKAKRVELCGARPVPIQIDGEAAGTTPVSLTVEPRLLRVVSA
jgi:diacylglycerol kinase family enzyme